MTTEPTRGNAADETDLWDRLARYVSGESSAAEADQVRAWLAADPRRAALLTALERSLQTVETHGPTDLDVEAALARVSARLDEPVVRSISSARGPARPAWRVGLIRAAATVAVLVGATVVWQSVRQGGGDGTTALATRTFEAPVGAVDSMRLPDGTRVLLAPGSRLNVGADYGVSSHDVELIGEALFDVAAAAAGRFTVRAGDAVITDLGTTFTVRSDAEREVRVVVTAGSVMLRAATAADSGTILRAGDRGVLSPAGEIVAYRGAASGDDLAWTRGQLVFNNATLAHVADELRRWYGVELQFAEAALANRHFTASFAGEDVAQVLSVLELALGVRVQRNGNTVVIHAAQDTLSR